jgi:raffinose/stachyose/melibiose transport system permease protein
MKEASASTKLFSLICLIGGIVLLIWSLALDFMGTKAGYRGALLVVGIIGIIAGM